MHEQGQSPTLLSDRPREDLGPEVDDIYNHTRTVRSADASALAYGVARSIR